MHSLLENYLADVARQLAPLPAARRSEELREMRQHLLNMASASQERGQTEDEAAAAAVEQCGPPKGLTEGLVTTWKREQARRRRDFLGAAVSVLVLSHFLPLWAKAWPLQLEIAKLFLRTAWFMPVFTGVVYTAHGLAGALGGLLFPKRAVAGTTLAVALCYGVPAIWVGSGAMWVYQPAVWVAIYAEFALLTAAVAWAFSRRPALRPWQMPEDACIPAFQEASGYGS